MIDIIINFLKNLFQKKIQVIDNAPQLPEQSQEKNTMLYGVTDAKTKGLNPDLWNAVLQIVAVYPYPLYLIEGVRTLETQEKYYNQGRTTPGPIITNAKPGQSPHNYGAAVDLVPFINGKAAWDDESKFKLLADTAQSVGLKAGYYFRNLKDSPHIELPNFWDKVKDGTLKLITNKTIMTVIGLFVVLSGLLYYRWKNGQHLSIA